MFSLKNFLTVILTAVLCLFIKTVPVCAAIQTDTFVPPASSTVEAVSSEETGNCSIHSPPQIFYEIQDMSDKVDITLTVEDDIVVETFSPVEYESEDYGQYVAESSGDNNDLFIIPLITQNNSIDNNADEEVVLALSLSLSEFPEYHNVDTIAQFGLMWFF